MKLKWVKVTSILISFCLIMTVIGKYSWKVPAQELTAHPIEVGDSWEGNPLKGFVPFEEKTSAFPHSMEWFYIPVSAVQTGMNTFDWTALEKRLNTIAARGHQAVMRFYYDYPGEESGVPQFLINQGVQMKYYNEPNDLGGSGYCPDYENATFRQSMINLIHAFGAQYDGDGRIGYITLGLLGFWGEWHNWPYDEDTSDGKPDWSISTTVYKEVLDAFDSSFNKTQLCVREPKSGINYANYDVGFHDDSFGYATLSQRSGGQDWSFMQKMYNFGLGNRWQTNCIGGEVYPPSQNDIFSGKNPDGTFQSWDLCMQEAHATWMLCEQMKYYSGPTKINARNAAKQLGYDFQVTTAYYPDNCDSSIPIKIEMKNIGSAPFYYDHTTWPVAIGIKQNGTIVKQWETDWDLCDIPADASVKNFSYTVENPVLQDGTYTLCMKVINPLENGNILGFANREQQNDGWLSLGNITISKNNEVTSGIHEEETKAEEVTQQVGTTVRAFEEKEYVKCQFETNVSYQTIQIYLDQDGNKNTGFVNGSDGLDTNSGFDYLIEGQSLYAHNGNNGKWSWNLISDVTVRKSGTSASVEISIPKSGLINLTSDAKIQLRLVDASWNGIYVSPLIAVEPWKENDGGLEINGYQINVKYGGVRTVYSADETIHGQDIQELGLIYGIDAEGYQAEDMTLNSKNPYVHIEPCDTLKGKYSETISKSQSYAMTMRFAVGNVKEHTTKYFVRAYAKLENGEIIYTDISEYTNYDIAYSAYQNQEMNEPEREYLYKKILMVVDTND